MPSCFSIPGLLVVSFLAHVIAGSASFAENPIVPNVGMSDPHIHIFNDRAYLYASHDYSAKNTQFTMYDWWVWSSSDLINWQYECSLNPADTYVGPMAGCWATDAAYKNGSYYWYLSVGYTTAVVRGDSPRGPWHDELGKPMGAGSYDPAIFTEDNGDSYVICGVYAFKIAKLNDDMVSLAETPREIKINNPQGPYGVGILDDKPDLHKHKDTYYLTWGSYYATSKSVYGPFECKGPFIDTDLVSPQFRHKMQYLAWGGLNYDRHGKFFEWNGQWYYACNDQSQSHTTSVYRDTVISYAFHKDDGEIAPLIIDKFGVSRIDSKSKQLISALRNKSDQNSTMAIIKELPSQDERTQALLLYALANRNDKITLPAIIESTKAPSERVRTAAMYGLAELGGASAVTTLAELAANASLHEDERETAMRSLNRMKGEDVNSAIAKSLERASAEVRAVLVRSLADRKAYDYLDAILIVARDNLAPAGIEAAKSLARLAKGQDLPKLVKLLTEIDDDQVRREVELAVFGVTKKESASQESAGLLLNAAKKICSTATRVSLIHTMGRIGHKSTLATLDKCLQDDNGVIKGAALYGLSVWPDGSPAKILSDFAADESEKATDRMIALRGFIKLIPKQTQRSDAALLDNFELAMGMAERAEEKKLVLAQLGGFRFEGALDFVGRFLSDSAVNGEAKAAIKKIEALLANSGSATASHNSELANKAIDGDTNTRWSTGGGTIGGEWLQVELDPEQVLTGISIECQGSETDYPRGYEIYVSMNSFAQGIPVATGKGESAVVDITFAKPVSGRSLKIVQTGKSGPCYWTITELKLKTSQ
ncbi:MAG: HEAT repeat domain-containing protein [Pirellulales bacterium]|nr:HEAT repeat domain-containing protein [Pirellulales bacterium]